jgi:hypothetical protein
VRSHPDKRTLAFFAGALVLALLVRIPGLGRSLWYDELFTLVHFADTLPHALFAQRQANNHPLASLLAWTVRAAGDDPRLLRAPSVLLGVLGVLAVGWLVRQRSGPGAAVAAMLLAAFHPAHVAYSQEVRGYAALLLAAPLVAGLALDGRRPRLLALAVALGLFAHLSLVVLVLALAALAAHERAARTLVALSAGTLAALLLYAPMLSHLGGFAARELGVGGPDGLQRTVELFATCDARLLPPLLGAPFFVLAFLGGVRRARRLACVVLAASLILALAVATTRPLFHARFALALLPLLLALAGHGADALAPGRRAVLVAGPIVVVLAVATARRAGWETEPIQPALRAYPGARFVFTGLGAELHESARDPTHRVELFAREDGAFAGLYANVRVEPLR